MSPLNENPINDDLAEKVSEFIENGERIPPQDLLVGELSFGISVEQIREWRIQTEKERIILVQETPEQIVTALQKLYDGMKALEARGLRGNDLFLAVKEDGELLAI